MRLCDAYSIPVVTVVNTEGFVKSEGDDQAGGIRQAARMAGVYAEATTVKVAVLAGEAVGPVYTVFAASADWRIAVQGCTVAPLAPEAAVTVLYKDEIFASDNIQQATKQKAAAYRQSSAAQLPLLPTALPMPLPRLPMSAACCRTGPGYAGQQARRPPCLRNTATSPCNI